MRDHATHTALRSVWELINVLSFHSCGGTVFYTINYRYCIQDPCFICLALRLKNRNFQGNIIPSMLGIASCRCWVKANRWCSV